MSENEKCLILEVVKEAKAELAYSSGRRERHLKRLLARLEAIVNNVQGEQQ